MSQLPPPRDPDSLGQLIKSLASDGQALIRQEIDLARTELQDSAVSLAKGSALVAAGLLFAALGGLVLLVFAVLALGALLDGRYWLSSLIVGGILALIGVVLLLMGRRGMSEGSLKPEKSLETLRDTGDWARVEAQDFKNEIARKTT